MRTKLYMLHLLVLLSILILACSYPLCAENDMLRQRPLAESGAHEELFLHPEGNGKSLLVTTDPDVDKIIMSVGAADFPLIVIGPHPDDAEGASTGLMRRAIREGRGNIYLTVLTAGAGAGGVLDRQIPGHEGLNGIELEARKKALREGETLVATGKIGLLQDRVKFCGYGPVTDDPQANAVSMGVKQEREFVDYLKECAKGVPDGMPVAVAWNTAEDDHRAHVHSSKFVQSAINIFMKETGRPVWVMRFRLWRGHRDTERPNTYLLMSGDECDAKLDVLSAHQSQINRRELQGKKDTVITESTDSDTANMTGLTAKHRALAVHGFLRAEQFQIYKIEPPQRVQTPLSESDV